MIFLYKNDIQDMIDAKVFSFYSDLNDTRGLTLADGTVLINLSAEQWKALDDDAFIEELNNTITHELGHQAIRLGQPSVKFPGKLEEEIVTKFAGQFNPLLIETFI